MIFTLIILCDNKKNMPFALKVSIDLSSNDYMRHSALYTPRATSEIDMKSWSFSWPRPLSIRIDKSSNDYMRHSALYTPRANTSEIDMKWSFSWPRPLSICIDSVSHVFNIVPTVKMSPLNEYEW